MNLPENSEAFVPLIGLRLRKMGRASNLLWLTFGELREISNSKEGTKTVGQWALHVQCSWRISRRGHILIGRNDYFCDPAGKSLGSTWDESKQSQFDQVSPALCTEWESSSVTVISVDCDRLEGFSMCLSDQSQLDVFPDSSVPGEDWRLFQPYVSTQHLIAGRR